MPFDPEFDRVFEDLIKPALEEVGYDVNRADSLLNQHNILIDIVRGIAEADLVVADLTSVNPNVFYELGISHTMQRPTVLLAQTEEGIPFDITSYRVIRYSVRFDEAPKLSQTLKELGVKAKSGKLGFGNPVSDFLPQIREPVLPQPIKAEKATLETEGKKETKAAEEEEEEEEKGLWDFAVDGEKSFEDISSCVERMSKETEGIGEKMQQRAIEMQKLAQNKVPGTASQVHKLATAVAIDISRYANKLEEEQPKFQSAWEAFDENTTGLVRSAKICTEDDKKPLKKFRSMVDILRSETRNLLTGMSSYRESIEGLRGISRDVNRASKRVVRVLVLLISDIEGADSYCTKVLTLLDEKIEKDC